MTVAGDGQPPLDSLDSARKALEEVEGLVVRIEALFPRLSDSDRARPLLQEALQVCLVSAEVIEVYKALLIRFR